METRVASDKGRKTKGCVCRVEKPRNPLKLNKDNIGISERSLLLSEGDS